MGAVDELIKVARAEIGVVEFPPGSNRQKYGAHFGENGVPWCDFFVSWCAEMAGLSSIIWVSGSVPSRLRKARSLGQTDRIPRVGALPCSDWNVDQTPDHIEILTTVGANGWFDTVGGNTSRDDKGSQSNGGGVFARRRHISTVQAFIHPPYQEIDMALTQQEIDAIAQASGQAAARAVWGFPWSTGVGKPPELAQDRLVQAARGGGLNDDLAAISAQLTALWQSIHAGTPVVMSQEHINGIASAIQAVTQGTQLTAAEIAVAVCDEQARRLQS